MPVANFFLSFGAGRVVYSTAELFCFLLGLETRSMTVRLKQKVKLQGVKKSKQELTGTAVSGVFAEGSSLQKRPFPLHSDSIHCKNTDLRSFK